MNHSTYSCIKQSSTGESGAAAIATLLHHYGLSLSFRDMRSILGLERLQMDLFNLLFAAQKLGFEAVPLEGDFEDLPEVPLPNIVSFKSEDPEEVQFTLLYEIDEHSALIGNTETGEIKKLTKEDFVQFWTGDVVQILPHEKGFEELRKQLADLHNLWKRAGSVLGWAPFSITRLLFLPAVAAVAAVALIGAAGLQFLSEKFALVAIGACLSLSLWHSIYSGACKKCSRLSALVGSLPLAQIGILFYASLFLLAAFLHAPALLITGLLFASGAHLFLIYLLARSKLICWPCVGVALFAILATALSIAASASFPLWEAVGLFVGFSSVQFVTTIMRKLHELETRDAAYRLSYQVASEERKVPEGRVRLVVYKRKNCSYCSLFDTSIRPAIEQDFGEMVVIEERDAANEKTSVPLIIVLGTVNFSMIGLNGDDGYIDLKVAIESALNPDLAPLKALSGIYLLQSKGEKTTKTQRAQSSD